MKPCILLLFLASAVFAQNTVEYALSFPNAVHHEVEVQVRFTGLREPVLEVEMSRSSPGRYALHEFAKNVYNFRATDEGGRPLQITRPDPYGWNVTGHKGTVVVTYTVFGDHADGTYAAIDDTHAHLNLPAVLAWARGHEHDPVTLKFDTTGNPGWKIASQLIPRPDGTYSAPNLEWLMDSPVELSAHKTEEWKIDGVTFRLALHHRGSDEEARVYARMCEAVVLEEEGIFGAFPKYDDGTYTFLVDYLPYVSGDGMEHRDSTVITSSDDLKSSWSQLIGSVSHEFFHSWNVKRIRPRSLEPFDFERANMSGELWFAEGFTNYYGMLALERAGLSSLDQFVNQMGRGINTVVNSPGAKIFNVIDMSRIAPFVDAARSIDQTNVSNTYISYYTYGQALALGIDLAIREQFPGKSLDDWMRTMWREHPDIDKPYTLEDLEQSLAETTGSQSFATDVFQHHISGMEPIDYAAVLAPAGLLLRKEHPGTAWMGVPKLDISEGVAEITGNSLRGSPLYEAGMDAGDKILKWDGKTLKSMSDINAWISGHKPGDKIQLSVVTRSGERVVPVMLQENPALELVTYETAALPVSAEIKAFRRNWLSSKSLHPLPQIPQMP